MLSIIIVLGALLLVSAIVFVVKLRRYAGQWRNLRLTEVGPYVDMLLRRGYDHAFLVIWEMNSPRFVQFAKYITENREYGIYLGFPKAPWSEPYYEAFRQELRENGIDAVSEPAGTGLVTEFTNVDCGTDVDRAMQLIQLIFLKVFRSGADVRVRVITEDISPLNEVIRDLSRKPGDWTWKEIFGRRRQEPQR